MWTNSQSTLASPSGEFLLQLTIAALNNFHICLINHLDYQVPLQEPGLHTSLHAPISETSAGPTVSAITNMV